MSFIDPIHGRIRISMWLNRILNHPLVRRTMYIRQLGIKNVRRFSRSYAHALLASNRNHILS